MNRLLFIVVLIFVSQLSFAQKKNKSKQKNTGNTVITNLQSHITFLADDKLEGRRTGTNGEKMAMEYISGQFQQAGLLAKGTSNYYQSFEVNEGKQIDPSTHLLINNIDLKVGGDYFPLPYSPDVTMEALPSISLRESDMPWFFDLKETLEENKVNPHFDLEGFIKTKAVNTGILGAHFDNLGIGEDGNSMLRTGEKLIHNGADDNASGTAALIELAKMITAGCADKKDKTLLNSNYLLIAFSGEELGLYGSKYFTENPTIDLKNANYMINMDMVGRLNDSSHALTVGGYGTSPKWGEYYASTSLKEKQDFLFKYDSSGTGPSDHTSFYRKDIPVLFFFTGLHTDYHKPSDDADRINYEGESKIINHIYSILYSLN